MKKILAVDDDADILLTLKEELEFCGHKVDVLQNPLDVENSIKSDDYDIILLDIVMPELNGLELLEKIHPYKKKSKFVLLSGMGTVMTADPRSDLADLIIDKPYTLADIKRILD